MSYKSANVPMIDWSQVQPFSNFIPSVSPFVVGPINKQETTMYDEKKTDETLRYVTRRLQDISWAKQQDLITHFKVNGIKPKSVKETKEWLKSGNYRIEVPKGFDEDEEGHFFYWRDFFSWGKEEPNLDAYAEACAKLEKAHQAAKDTVSIVTDEQTRLKTVKDFQDAKFH